MGVIWKVVLVLFVLVTALVGAYVYTLSKVEVRQVSFNSLESIDLTGFTLSGYVEVYNGGILPIGVDYIEYDIILEDSNAVLSSGQIEGDLVSPQQTKKFGLNQRVNWVPTAEVALRLVTPGETYAIVRGVVHVADLGFVEFKVPFETKFDLEVYLKQFIKSKVQEVTKNAVNTVKNTISSIGEGIGNFIDGFLNENEESSTVDPTTEEIA